MSYTKNCQWCDQEILLTKAYNDDKWKACEITGDPHLCQNKLRPASIVKQCTWCSQAIELLLIEDRYRPYNEDRTLHRCDRREQK